MSKQITEIMDASKGDIEERKTGKLENTTKEEYYKTIQQYRTI